MFKKGLKKKVLPIAVVSLFVIGGLVGALSTAEAEIRNSSIGKVKNIIFMIPDGFSSSYVTNYRWYKGRESLMDSMLVGMIKTYSASSEVTDSAAAGTAMATGEKTNNGMISTSPDGKELKTILEAAEMAGKATGLVVTASLTHATPAVFASHVASRANEMDIAPQFIKNDVDVLLGGGRKYFTEPLLKIAKAKGYEIVNNREQLEMAGSTDKLIGLFATVGLAPELDRDETKEPSLAEMSQKALDVLKKDKNGFFLMIEGSQIDWAGHANDAAWAMKDIEAFENALKEVLEFAKMDKNTLVVIAGDHDTGGMSVGGYGQYDANLEILRNVIATGDFMESKLNADRSNINDIVKEYAKIDLTVEEVQKIKAASKPAIAINKVISKRALVGWTSLVHTGTDVPIYAFGPSSYLFSGLHNNTDLPKLMAQAMNINF
ncbi:alkaline phosphatase [Cytobacillus dafuensis]|nr:alkaline phosphatase [Cytobacillus dafuensis]